MKSKVEKPIVLQLKELEQQVIELINNCSIPSFILKLEFEKIMNQLQIIEQQELEAEMKNYNKKIEESEKNGKN